MIPNMICVFDILTIFSFDDLEFIFSSIRSANLVSCFFRNGDINTFDVNSNTSTYASGTFYKYL